MAVTEQEYRALENQLVEAGVSRSVARSRLDRIKRGASGREVFNLLFEDQMAKVAKDAMAELFRVKSPSLRAVTFDKLVKELLSYSGNRPSVGQARRNLEMLGLDEDWIAWAVTERSPFTPRKIAQEVVKLQTSGQSQERAWREGLKLAAQDRIIEQAMRGEVTQLGDFGIGELILLIAAIVAAVLAVIALIIEAVGASQLEDEADKLKKERQNRPLTEIDKIQLAEMMSRKDTWEDARRVALTYITAHREGRRDFVETEEADLKSYWTEFTDVARQEEYEKEIEHGLYALETSRITTSAAKASRRREGFGIARASLIEAGGRIKGSEENRAGRLAVTYGIPAVIGVGILTGMVYLAKR